MQQLLSPVTSAYPLAGKCVPSHASMSARRPTHSREGKHICTYVNMSSTTSARPLKTVCTVWVAATSDEVHSTQGLLEAQGDSQRLGKRGK